MYNFLTLQRVGFVNNVRDMCQFLIGNVQPNRANVTLESDDILYVCQFLIGNVQRLFPKTNSSYCKCQFLIGNVQPEGEKNGNNNCVSIPHRQCTTRKKIRKKIGE